MREELLSATDDGLRMAGLDDRSLTPFTCSTLEEIFRMTPTINLNVPHMTEEDAFIRGHKIPKGTQVNKYS